LKGKYTGHLHTAVQALGIMAAAVLAGLVIDLLGLRAENTLLIFLLAVVFIIVTTKNFLYGIVSSGAFVILFNYFFTSPRYTFHVTDANYYISLILFIVTAVVASTLTTQLQARIDIAQKDEEIQQKLYMLADGLLKITGEENIVSYSEHNLSGLLPMGCSLRLDRDTEYFSANEAAAWCLKNSCRCGCGDERYGGLDKLYMPLKTAGGTIGVAEFDCADGAPDRSGLQLAETVLSEITMAVERERLREMEEENRLRIQREELKSNLLRSISHDLRTPLTGIAGGAGFLRENLSELDDETIRSVLDDINSDAIWLGNLVENLLNMTRIQEGRLQLNIKNEVVDDIISEAVMRIKKRGPGHELVVQKPDEVLLVPMDGQLIIQVLVNLIDNAFKHTPAGSKVYVSARVDGDSMLFQVADNGGGIRPENLDKIFEGFYTAMQNQGDSYRGMGLGLSICRSIAAAHHGTITAENNAIGGATFSLRLPLEVEK